MSTINDVAEMAGVSVTTVSHALSGKRPVAPATRRRIMAAVDRLNYQPSQLAIAMLTGRTNTLGALVPDIQNPFFGELLSAVESSASAFGYGTIVASTDMAQRPEQRQIAMLCAKSVDAILLIGCSDEATCFLPEDSTIPVIVADQMPKGAGGYPLIRSDYEAGGAMVADHLFGLGHRRIGVVVGPPTMSVAAARLDGFLDRMVEHDQPVPRSLRAAAEHFTVEDGLAAARRLLQRRSPPTALFCANDLIAYGALHAAQELGFKVPDDLSVAGFDDIFVSSMIQPTLTTVRQDIAGLGRRAVEMAVAALSDGGAPPSTPADSRLDVSLVIRQSTAPVLT